MDEDGETLIQSILTDIRREILGARLGPGQRLKIEDLRRHYDAGGSTVREALSQLCADGLVVRLSQRGFRVASVSLEDFDDLVDCRCRLEEMALRDAIANGNDRWEEVVVLTFHRLSRVARSIDTDHFVLNPEWELLHRAFHTALLAGCESNRLKRFCAQLYDQAVRYRAIADIPAYPTRDIHGEHRMIMELATTRRQDEAVAALKEHYYATGTYLRELLSKQQGWQSEGGTRTHLEWAPAGGR